MGSVTGLVGKWVFKNDMERSKRTFPRFPISRFHSDIFVTTTMMMLDRWTIQKQSLPPPLLYHDDESISSCAEKAHSVGESSVIDWTVLLKNRIIVKTCFAWECHAICIPGTRFVVSSCCYDRYIHTFQPTIFFLLIRLVASYHPKLRNHLARPSFNALLALPWVPVSRLWRHNTISLKKSETATKPCWQSNRNWKRDYSSWRKSRKQLEICSK